MHRGVQTPPNSTQHEDPLIKWRTCGHALEITESRASQCLSVYTSTNTNQSNGREQKEQARQQARERVRRGRQQRTGREKVAGAEKVAQATFSSVQGGFPDLPKENTSVKERQAPKHHPQHGVEGGAPHRAEAFVAMRRSEERKRGATTQGMTTGPSQDTTRYPEGETSKQTYWTRKPQWNNQGGGRGEGERGILSMTCVDTSYFELKHLTSLLMTKSRRPTASMSST